MIKVTEFESEFVTLLPETYNLLRAANLIVHRSVQGIILHGSRGLAGGYRPDSDVDLSLIVSTNQLQNGLELDGFLRKVIETTLDYWQSTIEADLAAIFDIKNCDLKCFDKTTFNEKACKIGGVDCFGIYKIQKGFDRFVVGAGIQVKLMYPCLTIWRNNT